MKLDTVCRLCSACCPVTAEVVDGKLLGAERKSFLPPEQRLYCPKLQAHAVDLVQTLYDYFQHDDPVREWVQGKGIFRRMRTSPRGSLSG